MKDQIARLKMLRKCLGLSQRELARELGVTCGAIGLWETNRRSLPGPALRLIEIYEAEAGISAFETPSEVHKMLVDRTSRNLNLLKITSTVFGQWLVSKLWEICGRQSTSAQRISILAMADQVSAELGKMKGLPMKLGQILGYLELGLPSEVNQALSELHIGSEFLSRSIIKEVIRKELGETSRELFSNWEDSPVCAASVGQVHRARLRTGELIAVKVQYPGVKESIESDLKILSRLSKFSRYLFHELSKGDLLSELKERLTEECDYQMESSNQEKLRQHFLGREGMKVPKIYKQFTSCKVMVSEFCEGVSFQQFLRDSTQNERHLAAERIWQFTFESWLRCSKVQVDPHPGNFLFEKNHVVFLDFGCMKEVSEQVSKGWKEIARSMINHRFDDAIDQLHKIGMVGRVGHFDRSQFKRFLKLIFEPYLEDRPYTFSEQYCRTMIHDWFGKTSMKSQIQVHKDWVFLTRIIWGTTSILAKLGAQSNWRRKLIPLLYEDTDLLPQSELLR